MSNSNFSGSHVLVAFLAGAAAGAVVALLTAPKSGKETRDDIRNWGERVSGTAVRVPSALRSASQAAAQAFGETLKHEAASTNT